MLSRNRPATSIGGIGTANEPGAAMKERVLFEGAAHCTSGVRLLETNGMNMAGFIYIMSNPAFALIKIGKSDNPDRRADELNATGVPERFKVEYRAYVEDPDELEKQLHLIFDHARPNPDREFFNVPIKEVIREIRKSGVKFEQKETEEDDDTPPFPFPTENDGTVVQFPYPTAFLQQCEGCQTSFRFTARLLNGERLHQVTCPNCSHQLRGVWGQA
jgi:hypothetical protein